MLDGPHLKVSPVGRPALSHGGSKLRIVKSFLSRRRAGGRPAMFDLLKQDTRPAHIKNSADSSKLRALASTMPRLAVLSLTTARH
jgi:hypothetical protein